MFIINNTLYGSSVYLLAVQQRNRKMRTLDNCGLFLCYRAFNWGKKIFLKRGHCL